MFPNPSAKSFTPSSLEFAIYNEGVPNSTFYGNQPEHDVLQSISEEAIATCFPPNAEEVRYLLPCALLEERFAFMFVTQHILTSTSLCLHLMSYLLDPHCSHNSNQAAELDAADDFVETMAWLSYLDECDERARFSYEGLGKRWHARRSLIGKPTPMREGVQAKTRSGTFIGHASETDLVSYASRKFEEKPRKIGKMYGGHQYGRVARNVRTNHGFNVIQQPRKQN